MFIGFWLTQFLLFILGWRPNYWSVWIFIVILLHVAFLIIGYFFQKDLEKTKKFWDNLGE